MLPPRRNRRVQPTHDNDQQDRYLLTYADMITLLLGLFVILYASSQTDSVKFKEVAAAMNVYFQANDKNVDSLKKISALQGGNGVLQGRQGVPEQIYKQDGNGTATLTNNQIESDVRSALGDVIKEGSVDIQRVPEGVLIRLGEAMMFESGKAALRKSGAVVLDTLARTLQAASYTRSIIFVGHTDSVNIRSFQFESNWHLSTARALTIAYYCMERGIYEKYVEIQGVGAQQPIADNATPEGRNRNRRVEVLIREIPAQRPTINGYVRTP